MSDLNELYKRLPEGEWQPPYCGICWEDMESYDGKVWACDDCCLIYIHRDGALKPEYQDSEADPCWQPCQLDSHKNPPPVLKWNCERCSLPTGHTGPHYNGCDYEVVGLKENQ